MAGSDPGMVIRVAADLADLESGLADASAAIGDLSGELAAAAASFDGGDLVAEAAAAATAMDDIGASAAATATEQDGVNAAVDAGVQAYGALAATGPPAMADLADQTANASDATGGLSAGVIAAATALGTFAASLALAGLEAAINGIKSLGGFLADLVVTGSDVADVAGSFDTLAASAGLLGDTLLARVRAGTQGTITDLDLMSTLSRDLNVDLQLTTAQFGTLADGAFALAQTGRVDVKQAFELMNDAMVTGRTRALAMQGITVDLDQAEQHYRDTHADLADKLTATQQLEVTRGAILDGVAAATARLGEQTAGLDEMVDQAAVAWENFKNQVGAAVAESDVLRAGLDALKQGLIAAFGGDTDALIKTIVRTINTIAITAVDVGLVLVEWSKTAVSVFGLVLGPIDALSVAVNGIATAYLDGLTMMYDAAAKIPLIGSQFEATAGQVRGAADSWREYRDKAIEGMNAHDAMWKGQSAAHDVLNTTTTLLTGMKTAMVAASLETQNATRTHQAHTAAVTETAAALTPLLVNTRTFTDAMYQLRPSVVDTRDAVTAETVSMVAMADATDQGTAAMHAASAQAVDLSDQVRFAAETVQHLSMSWSDAMAAVGRGEGTMTGTIGPATKPAGMSDMEFRQMQTDPRTWEIQHGYDWQSPGGTGSAWKWLDSVGAGGGATTTTNINVATVMGDKHEIARVVKEALADDWRSTGARA